MKAAVKGPTDGGKRISERSGTALAVAPCRWRTEAEMASESEIRLVDDVDGTTRHASKVDC